MADVITKDLRSHLPSLSNLTRRQYGFGYIV